MTLTKEQILGAKDLPTKVVKVPEWGGEIIVRTMSGDEKDAYDVAGMTAEKEVNYDNMTARLCAATIVDDAGNLLFSLEEIEALGKKSAKALNRVYQAAAKLNGLTRKDVDEMIKNSGSIPIDDSTIG